MDVHSNYWKPCIESNESTEMLPSNLFGPEELRRYTFIAPFNYSPVHGTVDDNVFSLKIEGRNGDLEVYITYNDKQIYNLKKLIPWPYHIPVEISSSWGFMWDRKTRRPDRIFIGKCKDATEGMLSFLHEVGHLALLVNNPIHPVDPYKLNYQQDCFASVDPEMKEKEERAAWYLAFMWARRIRRETGVPLFESRSLKEVRGYVDSFIESHKVKT